MLASKEKICKCGHLKELHKDNPKSKLSFPGECSKCKCNDYMNRRETGKISTLTGVIMSGVCGIFLLTFGLPLSMLNNPITVPVSVFGIILSAMVILLILQLFPSMTLAYFNYKKRKEYPIE